MIKTNYINKVLADKPSYPELWIPFYHGKDIINNILEEINNVLSDKENKVNHVGIGAFDIKNDKDEIIKILEELKKYDVFIRIYLNSENIEYYDFLYDYVNVVEIRSNSVDYDNVNKYLTRREEKRENKNFDVKIHITSYIINDIDFSKFIFLKPEDIIIDVDTIYDDSQEIREFCIKNGYNFKI